MAIVVSDTSPIRALGHLGRLELLRDLYVDLLIPPAVEAELRRPPTGSAPVDIRHFPFIHLRSPSDPDRARRIVASLDRGESEALALALEVEASLVLIHESMGRAAARRLGLVPIGVIGTLLRAKQRGYLGAIAPLIDRLRDEFRFFVSDKVRSEALRAAGEPTGSDP